LKIENLGVSDMSNRYDISKNNKLVITIYALRFTQKETISR